MNFNEMFDQLLKGKFITRETWKDSGDYIGLMPNMNYIWKITMKSQTGGVNASAWLILMEDFLATDFKIVEEGYKASVVQLTETSEAVPV